MFLVCYDHVLPTEKEMKLAHSFNLLRQIWNSMKLALAREGKWNDEDA